MGLRHVVIIASGFGRETHCGSTRRTAIKTLLGVTAALGLVLTLLAGSPVVGAESDGANIRVASYQSLGGEAYFAAAIQPSPNDAILQATGEAAADVVVIVDTSASQVGGFRSDSIVALESLLKTLQPTDRVRVFAGDVKASDLSERFAAGDAPATQRAIERLRQRLPLGHTNLVTLIDAVRASLVAEPENHTRSIVYIGDGASIDATGNQNRFAGLVDALRADRISVHTIVIGPVTNLETTAILANQTGGVLGVVGVSEEGKPTVIGRQVGAAARRSAVWIDELKLIDGMSLVQSGRIPPLRLERDSILLGRLSQGDLAGTLTMTGETTTSSVRLVLPVTVESNHPDFSFLPALVKQAEKNDGLLLASAGSPLLRMTAQLIAQRAEELVRAGEMALKQGNQRGAKAMAEKVLEVDPENLGAQSIQKISGGAQRLVLQNPGDSVDDVFGGGGDAFGDNPFGAANDAVGDDPFGAGSDPLGAGLDDDAAVAPAAVPPAPPVPPTNPPVVTPPPPAAAPPARRPSPPPLSSRLPVGDDELRETGGDLLRGVEQQRSAMEGRLRAEVRAQLRAASMQLRTDPKGVPGQLKSLLATVETTPDINPQLRQELTSQVRSAIQAASVREARFSEDLARLESQAAAAEATARLLEGTFRREATLKTLSRQMNDLIAEGRYDEADGQVSLEFARIAGDSVTRDSVAGRHFTDQPLMLQVYDRDRRYREMRERNFVDAFSLVLKSNIPFVDEPPIVWPDADVWRRLSDRRIDRYGSIDLSGENETEQRVERRNQPAVL